MSVHTPDLMSMELPRHRLQLEPSAPDHAQRASREWVLADAQGGFAMGSAGGTPLRRYHGLLIASLKPPVCRLAALSAIDEHVRVGDEYETRLTPFRFAGQGHTPSAPYSLIEFTKGVGTCSWTYKIDSPMGTVQVCKSLTLIERSSACTIEYEITPEPIGLASGDVELTLRPLIAMRDFHDLNHPGTLQVEDFQIEHDADVVRVSRQGIDETLSLSIEGAHIESDPSIWQGLNYEHESRRHQRDTEDLFAPIAINASAQWGATTRVALTASIGSESVQTNNHAQRLTRVNNSIEHALKLAGNPSDPKLGDAIAKLAAAADDFVVDRAFDDSTSTSIIAGYPWFSDWGRDTMICIPGLLLTTGRFDEAEQCLRTFARAREHGLIPNRFDDDAGPAHFNTVDAPLWFVHACAQWPRTSKKPLHTELIEACDDIISAYAKGTINKIGLDPADGLIRAGDDNTQLTWMDALREDIAFTPRHGKAIEINALWINALRVRTKMGSISDDRSDELESLASQAEFSIIRTMTGGPHGGLVDCLIPHNAVRSFSWRRSDECRSNQVFAAALPGMDLPEHIRQAIVDATEDQLLTPAGLRTLSPDHPNYTSHYTGSMMDRDRAYHNGTVWPWLIGGYVDAKLELDPSSAASVAQHLLGMADLMDQDGVGSIHEIYDAELGRNDNHAPQGCPAQAWSIGEVLRGLIRCAQLMS